MSSSIAVSVPEPLRIAIEGEVEPSSLRRWALEALVMEAIREGLITRGRGGELLGLGFHEREALFAKRHLSYDLSDEERERELRDSVHIFEA